jgi:hypothetical protein
MGGHVRRPPATTHSPARASCLCAQNWTDTFCGTPCPVGTVKLAWGSASCVKRKQFVVTQSTDAYESMLLRMRAVPRLLSSPGLNTSFGPQRVIFTFDQMMAPCASTACVSPVSITWSRGRFSG